MSTPPDILYVQRRPMRAGAQTSLFRLVSTSKNKTVVLCHDEGWLTETLPNTLVAKWPSARSFAGRIGGLKLAARRILKKKQPVLVIANDHQECPFALAVAREAGVPCLAILRSSGMSQQDFEKYQCSQCDHLFIVGEELSKKTNQWTTTETSLFQEGFLENEFSAEPILPNCFPNEILVAGSSKPAKGFPDLIEALRVLESRHPKFPLKKVTLTGDPPRSPLPDLRCDLDFVGRVDDFVGFARNFHFAVHPSRNETFGLAPLELIIAGVPTLCTRTGVAGDNLLPTSWLTPPSSPEEMATALLDWSHHWKDRRKELKSVKDAIHSRFAISKTSAHFFETINRLCGES